MSWVFLTPTEAWKLKKPLQLGALDLRSRAARRQLICDELRLNRRFAPSVYLGLGAVTVDAAGLLRLRGADDAGRLTGCDRGGARPASAAVASATSPQAAPSPDERVAELLVRMRRLAPQAMLDAAIADGRADAAAMRAIAQAVAAHRSDMPRVSFDAAVYCARLQDDLDDTAAALRAPHYGLPRAQLDVLAAALGRYLQQHRTLLAQRLADGHVVEGHGDLRPEHVCLGPPVMFIDCLEFSQPLRELDVADELAFLALECERLGRADLGDALLQGYRDASGDPLPAPLCAFHAAHRALIRARLAIRHLDEAQYRGLPKWPARAREYLVLAERHVARLD